MQRLIEFFILLEEFSVNPYANLFPACMADLNDLSCELDRRDVDAMTPGRVDVRMRKLICVVVVIKVNGWDWRNLLDLIEKFYFTQEIVIKGRDTAVALNFIL